MAPAMSELSEVNDLYVGGVYGTCLGDVTSGVPSVVLRLADTWLRGCFGNDALMMAVSTSETSVNFY
jgi:hypothetical protein